MCNSRFLNLMALSHKSRIDSVLTLTCTDRQATIRPYLTIAPFT